LEAGYCKWVNPFSGRAQYVSFEKARAFVFWTKNAEPFVERLAAFDARGMVYYFQFTLNDYAAEGLEPGVPPLAQRIGTFQRLSERIGRERVVWRFDPLILTGSLGVKELAERVGRIGDQLHPYTEKLVISFADIAAYAKVRRNLGGGARAREFAEGEMVEMAARIAEMARGWGIRVATCCEKVELGTYGIEHNRCVDDELLLRISGGDTELARVLRPGLGRSITDPGQREMCGCVISKDIGAYNTCPHLCRYCYANTSAEVVRKRMGSLAAGDEGICP
jgi:hypothetical protein